MADGELRTEIGMEEWKSKLSKQKTPRKVIDGIVMNYLVVNGYKNVAAAFVKDSGMKPDVPLESIQNRMDIRKAVFEGNIPKVIEKVNDLNPDILGSQPKLYFLLQQQRMIELIRQGPEKISECLGFARRELAPRAAENEQFLEDMERVMALLAFPDPSKSAVGHLLSYEQRQKVVSAVNTAILTSQCQSTDPRLLFLLRQLAFTQSQLQERIKLGFPIIRDFKEATFCTMDEEKTANKIQKENSGPKQS
uniref:CTLH domain-containing protein n=1 Tax=Lotharella oceanica TaxID=641309 RepID=A0A7S2TZC1_9EUKA|eukprot:CAMPEP_0170176242 /NCGR_PEP_ID=MMETSP0040_2-20121228/9168_1 /TAXON_ID=641309 /ORGANISM="Lotharella oceanica, Strain CCMP622" /LENGTH=249 /DNA_ID=CAMNT_0010418509 /DNA_START=121 /DNA_END=870 /DNA_ORIENTATION=-